MLDNICAIATPYGTGAISIIRCSGPKAIEYVNNIFKGKNLNKCQSHTIHYGFILNDGEVVDEVLCNIFKAPNSFDGENCVEINCHGGPFVTSEVLKVLLKSGFRLAERGEFSKRAFLNKKLDLTQAEAIMDIISSNNKLALKSSTNSLRSKTANMIKDFRDKILQILAEIEVNIDYPEYEDSVEVTHNYLMPIIDEMLNDMEHILDNSTISTVLVSGIKTAIVGKPNVGKSSLLNMLLNEDKAIVSNVAGTTRDLVEGMLNIRNITLHLIDTAGIRKTDDPIEKIGIEKSIEKLYDAELVLLVLDQSQDLTFEDKELLEKTKNKTRIIIGNKSDLPKANLSIKNVVDVSSLKQEGLENLKEEIKKLFIKDSLKISQDLVISSSRHISIMKRALSSLKEARNNAINGDFLDMVEIDLREAYNALGEIIGRGNPDELIDELFARFCLGK